MTEGRMANRGTALALAVLTGVTCGIGTANATSREERVLSEIRHRAEVRKAMADPAQFKDAVKSGLKDADPMVRRYALLKFHEVKPEKAVEISRRFLDDPSAAVRQVAKSMNRSAGKFRDNVPLSMSESNDHSTQRLLTVKPVDGKFVFPASVPEHEGVELWFGRPAQDLYVTLNGVYLGQFDFDNQRGNEFRLNATKETRIKGENVVLIQDAKGRAVSVPFTAEVLTWR